MPQFQARLLKFLRELYLWGIHIQVAISLCIGELHRSRRPNFKSGTVFNEAVVIGVFAGSTANHSARRALLAHVTNALHNHTLLASLSRYSIYFFPRRPQI